MSPRSPDALAVALLVIDVLEELGVRYQIGGSFASSIHGVPRHTNDVDLVVDLEPRHVPELVRRLRPHFYLDAERIAQAVLRRSSANLLHLGSGIKIDLFVAEREGFGARELARSVEVAIPGHGRTVSVKSPEDTILRKLLWYRMGNEVSDRQWSDVEGIVASWGDDLDLDYLRASAVELEIADLVDRLL